MAHAGTGAERIFERQSRQGRSEFDEEFGKGEAAEGREGLADGAETCGSETDRGGDFEALERADR